MTSTFRTTLLLLALSTAAVFGMAATAIPKPPPQPVEGKIRWVYSYQEGKEVARRTGKPMFVVFRCER